MSRENLLGHCLVYCRISTYQKAFFSFLTFFFPSPRICCSLLLSCYFILPWICRNSEVCVSPIFHTDTFQQYEYDFSFEMKCKLKFLEMSITRKKDINNIYLRNHISLKFIYFVKERFSIDIMQTLRRLLLCIIEIP